MKTEYGVKVLIATFFIFLATIFAVLNKAAVSVSSRSC